MKKTIAFLHEYTKLFSAVIFLLIIFRIIEYLFLVPDEIHFYEGKFRGFTYSVEFDLIFVSLCYLISLLPAYLCYLLSRKVFRFFFYLFFILFVLVLLILNHFFHTNYLLLDKTVFFFSFRELLYITGNESGGVAQNFAALYIGTILPALALLIFIPRISDGSRFYRYFSWALILCCSLLFLSRKKLAPNQKEETNLIETQLYSSKASHFFVSISDHLWSSGNQTSEEELQRNVQFFRDHLGLQTGVASSSVPFEYPVSELHTNPWSEYLEVNDSTNFVVIFSESLSSSFIGKDAHFGNMMPFLDSLASQSLYWPNMLSITDRTHGIFSAALAGLPIGFERGILNYRESKFPEHVSIPKILHKKGYVNSFFYGGWSSYDGYRPFVDYNYFTNCIDDKYIKQKYGSDPKILDQSEHSWGYFDQELSRFYFKFLDEQASKKQKQAQFNLILTLSLHSPFLLPDQEKYIQQTRQNNPQLSKDFLNNFEKPLSCITYTDEFYRKFFQEYQRRPEYQNTVFLILGDHNLHTVGYKNVLDRYHVPFLIYSPKLKKSKQFNEIISHWDVPATLFDLMKLKQFPQSPGTVHWLGKGVQMKSQTRSVEPIFLGIYTGEHTGVLQGDHLLLFDKLYKVEKGLQIRPIQNDPLKDSLSRLLQSYQLLNRYTIENDLITSPINKENYQNANGL
ncbi:MAG: LTA synthase family protein [Bacteroidetes bacterium]|nr:MAG: LTA synthase family protein [Bacteroidota bacterium]